METSPAQQTLPNTASNYRIPVNTKLPYTSKQEGLTEHEIETAILLQSTYKRVKRHTTW